MHDAFVENCALSSAGNKKCWISKVKTLLNYLDTSINDHRDFDIFKLNVHLKSKFISNWKESISPSDQDHNIKGNKLRTFGRFKYNSVYEPYLDIVCNRYERSDLTKLRISAHKLAIETGRHARPFIPINMRKCLFCDSGEVEVEFHFLLNCTSLKMKEPYYLNLPVKIVHFLVV